MSKAKTNRNKEIIFRRRRGETYSDLAKYYGISYARVWKIVQNERDYEISKPAIIPEIKKACLYFNASDGMYGRIANALYEERLDVHNRWRKLSRAKMLSIRNIGEKAADILEYAQKIGVIS